MEQYYAQQAQLPHFSGPARQRGSGFGSLASGVGRVPLPFAKKFLLPAVKSIGKEFKKEDTKTSGSISSPQNCKETIGWI